MRKMKKLVAILMVIVLYVGSLFLTGKVLASDAREPAKIDYSLPYPGILPTSPIYFLKVARDQLMLFLIRDDREKAFYLLLLSDKRLAAGETLINKQSLQSSQAAGLKNNKSSNIGVMSVVRGEQYFSQAVDEAVLAKNKKVDVSDLFSKLTVASAKHSEVIGELSNKVSGKDAELLTKARRQNQNSTDRVREIFLQIIGVAK